MAETEAPLDGAPLAQTPAFYSAPVAPQGRKKRRRPALSCEQCRKRKIRCDRLQPCNHCVRSNITDCHYVPTHVPASWAKKAQQAAVTEQHAAIGLAPADPSPAPRVLLPTPSVSSSELGAAQPFCMIQLMGRIPTAPRVSPDAKDLMSVSAKDWAASMHFLEDKLDAVSISNTGSPSSHRDEDRSGSTRANAAKTTYYGPSHWLRSTSLVCFPSLYLFRCLCH